MRGKANFCLWILVAMPISMPGFGCTRELVDSRLLDYVLPDGLSDYGGRCVLPYADDRGELSDVKKIFPITCKPQK